MMDVCYLSASGALRITYQDRELLRRLVDAGVMLWIDDGGGLSFPSEGDGLFFPINFGPAGGAPQVLQPAHALLDGVYRLQPAESARLSGGAGVIMAPPAAESTALVDPTGL